MSERNLPAPASLLQARLPMLNGGHLVRAIHHGKNGIVYEAIREIAGHEDKVAVKIIPLENLRDGWQKEVSKPLLLPPAVNVVRPQSYDTYLDEGARGYACILLPWIDGLNLCQFIEGYPHRVTDFFCLTLAKELITFLHAMQSKKIQHGDIKLENILVEFSNDTYGDDRERFWLTDFGVGGSCNDLRPQDDFERVAFVLSKAIAVASSNVADGPSRRTLDLLTDVLLPRLSESNQSSPHYRQTRHLLDYVASIPDQCRENRTSIRPETLENPFDYLSCEQIGTQYGLLLRLCSLSFPNFPEFLGRTNTVLTGPRGCGKTTILRSLATKNRVLGGQSPSLPLDHLSIYFLCTDLFYAFPYVRRPLDERLLRGTVHYFNLSILWEVLDTLEVLNHPSGEGVVSPDSARLLGRWLEAQTNGFKLISTPERVLADLKAQTAALRKRAKRLLDTAEAIPKDELLGLDFLVEFFRILAEYSPSLAQTTTYLLLDDYSTPRVSEHLQASLNRLVFQRNPSLFCKVSTESILSLNQFDSAGKLLEQEREFDVIDLGTVFMRAEAKEKAKFLEEVIDTRFIAAERYDIPPVRKLLGTRQEKSYVEMARLLREGSQYNYHGIETLVDMCSGDITHTLHLVRDMMMGTGGLGAFLRSAHRKVTVPLDRKDQHAAIQRLGADFIENLKCAPKYGPKIAEVLTAFGEIAHWELVNLDSPNEQSLPPKQSFRIELKETLEFDKSEQPLRELYEALVRYGVFIRDPVGKSQRAAIVPRLYLRRLLVPRFRLTFSKRDNVGMEVHEFKELLRNPSRLSESWPRRKSSPDQLSLLPGEGNK